MSAKRAARGSSEGAKHSAAKPYANINLIDRIVARCASILSWPLAPQQRQETRRGRRRFAFAQRNHADAAHQARLERHGAQVAASRHRTAWHDPDADVG